MPLFIVPATHSCVNNNLFGYLHSCFLRRNRCTVWMCGSESHLNRIFGFVYIEYIQINHIDCILNEQSFFFWRISLQKQSLRDNFEYPNIYVNWLMNILYVPINIWFVAVYGR